LKGPGQAIVWFQVGELSIDLLLAADEFHVKQVGLDGKEAAEAPTGDGHDVDQVGFDGGLGLELIHEVSPEKLKKFVGFAGDKDRGGGEAVTATIGGGAGFSFGGDGAARLGSIGAGGFAFE
jgi:hypothetical protein